MGFSRIWVTGAQGSLGQELIPFLKAKGYQVEGSTSQSLNLLEPQEAITRKIASFAPEIIIHTAAMTQVDKAQLEPDLAMAINKVGTQKIALAANDVGAILCYVSTDYVFDGQTQTPYGTDVKPNPINTYGWSKYYGELMVQELCDTFYIVRTSWLYGVNGNNFVQFVLDAARQGRSVNIVNDQWGSPTWTGSLCHNIEKIVTSGGFGLYHGSDSGVITRYDQALHICKAAGLSADCIKPVSNAVFEQPAPRPTFTALDPTPLSVPRWETAFEAFLTQYFERQTQSAATHS
jgi:dTDP-4-dehydrorhamnose reductase